MRSPSCQWRPEEFGLLAEQKEGWGGSTVPNLKCIWGISTREEELFQLWVSVGAGTGEAEFASTFVLVFRNFLSTTAAKVWKSLLRGVVRAK